jgi:nucleoside-diphosphate kinase
MSKTTQTITLAILKPDTMKSRNVGSVIEMLENAGFKIRASKVLQLKQDEAEAFYGVHRERPFFESLVQFMTSGPCMPLALEHERAVPYLREVIGATDPSEAAEGTIRALYADSKERNAIHASDSDANAQLELGFFFSRLELITRA